MARARACPGQGDGQHLQDDPLDVVLRLRLGQAQRVDLHAVAEAAAGGVGDPVPLPGDRVPEPGEGPHLAHLLDEADARVHEEGDPPDDLTHLLRGDPLPDGVQDGRRGAQRVGDLLDRGGPGLLQVVAAHVDGVPLGHAGHGVGDQVGGQAHRGPGREDVRAAGEVLLDDVVLRRAGQPGDVRALLLGDDLVERQQPHGRGVDRHRGVRPLERDAVEQGPHVAQVPDRDADPADLAAGQDVVGVVAGLGGQVERHRQAGLALGQVPAEQRVGFPRGRVPGVGPHQPGLVPRRRGVEPGPVRIDHVPTRS